MHGSSLNHTYRLVWNACAGTYVAVAETTRGRGKSGRAGRVAAVVLGAAALMNSALADALPGAVLSGTNTVGTTTSTVIDGGSSTGYFVQSGNLTINNATFLLKQGASTISGTVTYLGTTATFSPVSVPLFAASSSSETVFAVL